MPPTDLAASLAELQGAVLRGEDRRSVIKAFHKTHNKHAGYLVALRTVNVAALLGGEVTESRMQLAELVVRSSAVDALQLMQSAPVVTSLTGQAPALDLSVQRVICAALSSAAKAEPADAAVDSTVPSFVAALFKYLKVVCARQMLLARANALPPLRTLDALIDQIGPTGGRRISHPQPHTSDQAPLRAPCSSLVLCASGESVEELAASTSSSSGCWAEGARHAGRRARACDWRAEVCSRCQYICVWRVGKWGQFRVTVKALRLRAQRRSRGATRDRAVDIRERERAPASCPLRVPLSGLQLYLALPCVLRSFFN